MNSKSFTAKKSVKFIEKLSQLIKEFSTDEHLNELLTNQFEKIFKDTIENFNETKDRVPLKNPNNLGRVVSTRKKGSKRTSYRQQMADRGIYVARQEDDPNTI